MAVDDLGEVATTGTIQSAVNLGTGQLASAGSKDIFVARDSSAGAHVWSKRTGAGSGKGIAADGGNNVIAAGIFSGDTRVNLGGRRPVEPAAPTFFWSNWVRRSLSEREADGPPKGLPVLLVNSTSSTTVLSTISVEFRYGCSVVRRQKNVSAEHRVVRICRRDSTKVVPA